MMLAQPVPVRVGIEAPGIDERRPVVAEGDAEPKGEIQQDAVGEQERQPHVAPDDLAGGGVPQGDIADRAQDAGGEVGAFRPPGIADRQQVADDEGGEAGGDFPVLHQDLEEDADAQEKREAGEQK